MLPDDEPEDFFTPPVGTPDPPSDDEPDVLVPAEPEPELEEPDPVLDDPEPPVTACAPDPPVFVSLAGPLAPDAQRAGDAGECPAAAARVRRRNLA